MSINFTPSQDMISAATAVFTAMAYVQTIEPIVRGYQKKILDKYKFKIDKRWTENKRRNPGIITDPKRAYLMSDDDFKFYLEELNEERKKAGLRVENPEFCPLLVAEDILNKAEFLLCQAMEPITKITHDQIMRSGLDKYKKYIDLSLKLLAPFVKNEQKAA